MTGGGDADPGAPALRVHFPLREAGVDRAGVVEILQSSDVGEPDYYRWRSRSGCTFCFFQRKYEWVMLHENHPDKFQEAIEYEKEFPDGRRYTWSQGETLIELLARKEEIIADHKRMMEQQKKACPNRALVDVLSEVLDSEDDTAPCVACHY